MEDPGKIIKRISELAESGEEFAVATIVSASEGTPRKTGTKMIIYPDSRFEYTIGGGALEEKVIEKSVDALKKGESLKFSLEMTEDKSGMACGGKADIFIEVFKKQEKVIIFGGGHIGLSLSKILNMIEIPYVVIDNRKEYASAERFPDAAEVKVLEYDQSADKLKIDDNTYCVIITHGHKGDRAVLKGLLDTPAAYIGMIGSDKKINTVFKKIEEEGMIIDNERIYSPIGLDTGGESPAEIAVSIAAEILTVKYNKTGISLKNKK
ncbi:XdhC family protein [Elusimicrobiota bacterium]